MKFILFILILPFLWFAFDAKAQVVQEASSMPEQWQLTLDVIKSKAQTLIVENNGLKGEYGELTGQLQKLQQSIDDQQNKNEQMEQSLKERHNQTDQQARIEELTRSIRLKAKQSRTEEEQLENLRRKELLQGRHSQEAEEPQVNDQLTQLRSQLENESQKEVLLENRLRLLKSGENVQGVEYLKKRKEQLEADIYTYESHLDELRQSSLMALSWPLKRKKLIHEMALVDARNNKMRDMIKVLHEDINVLKDQVSALEGRLNSIQGKDIN